MKRSVSKTIFVSFITALMCFVTVPCAAQENVSAYQPCQYELRLNLNEYSVLSSATVFKSKTHTYSDKAAQYLRGLFQSEKRNIEKMCEKV